MSRPIAASVPNVGHMQRVSHDIGRLDATVARARSHTLGDIPRRSASMHPSKTAIIDGDVVLTFAEFENLVDRAAKQVFFVDILPKNPSGKLLKRELRTRFGAGQGMFH
jgi:acyl-CoA synthetase (AMP-forming)/AMP-acid ligase II